MTTLEVFIKWGKEMQNRYNNENLTFKQAIDKAEEIFAFQQKNEIINKIFNEEFEQKLKDSLEAFYNNYKK